METTVGISIEPKVTGTSHYLITSPEVKMEIRRQILRQLPGMIMKVSITTIEYYVYQYKPTKRVFSTTYPGLLQQIIWALEELTTEMAEKGKLGCEITEVYIEISTLN